MEDARDFTLFPAAASRTRSPRIDPDRLSLRQSRRAPEPRRNPIWDDPVEPRRLGPERFLDRDYVAIRRMLQSLATDGQRLVHGKPGASPVVAPCQVGSFLRQLDRFDELAAARGLEPVRRWARRLRTLVLDAGTLG